MSDSELFDVFLSHNRSDKPAVEEIAKQIRSEGLNPWLDKWHLTPGKEWQNEIELALQRCNSCVVFIGPNGIGSWQSEEMRAAIDRRATDPKKSFLVIPVLLPGGNLETKKDLPAFLTATTWVEYENSLNDPESFRRLLCGIRGINPDQAEDTSSELVCPYRGLQFFDVDDHRYFFGRKKLTQKLLDSIDPNQETQKPKRFFGIVGASGSGKSSLARAGLIASLKQNKISGSDKWLLRICRPKSDPLTSLATSLVHSLGGETPQVIELRKSFADTESALNLHADLCLFDSNDQARMVVMIDQFEEVFTQCQDLATRQQFIDNLLYPTTLPDSKVIIVLTMRADFYGQCGQYPKLADALSSNQILVSPPTTSELRELLEQPARMAGCELQSGLAQRIIEDTQKQAGSLPLIQHALMELWNRRDSRVLTHHTYEEIGGVVGALEKRAEETFLRLNESEQKLCRQVFLRLVEPGDATNDTKRQATLSEVLPRNSKGFQNVQSVIDSLADGAARLITLDKSDETQEQKLEVSHEALINGWQRFQGWISEDREGLRIHRRLSTAALQWNDNGRDSGYLYHGAVLLTAEEWSRKPETELNDLEESFLSSSLAERDTKIEKKKRLDRRLRLMAISSISLAICAAIFMCFVGYFAYQNHKNEKRLASETSARIKANSEKLEAQRAAIEKERIHAKKELVRGEVNQLFDSIDVVFEVNGTDQALVFERLATSSLEVRIEFINQLLSKPEKAQRFQTRLGAILTVLLTADFSFGDQALELTYHKTTSILAKNEPSEVDRRNAVTCFLLMSNLLETSQNLPSGISKVKFESAFVSISELASKQLTPPQKLQWTVQHFLPRMKWLSSNVNRLIAEELLTACLSPETEYWDITSFLGKYREYLSIEEKNSVVTATIEQYQKQASRLERHNSLFDFGLAQFVDDVPQSSLLKVAKRMSDYAIFDAASQQEYFSPDDFRRRKRDHLEQFRSVIKRMTASEVFEFCKAQMSKSYSTKSHFAALVNRLTHDQKKQLEQIANQRLDSCLTFLSKTKKIDFKQWRNRLATLEDMHQELTNSPPNRKFIDTFSELFFDEKTISQTNAFTPTDDSDQLDSWFKYANTLISICEPPSNEIVQKYEKAIIESIESNALKVLTETAFGIPKRLSEMNMPIRLKKHLFIYVTLLNKLPPEKAYPFVDRLTDHYFDHQVFWTQPSPFQFVLKGLHPKQFDEIIGRLIDKIFAGKTAEQIAKQKLSIEAEKSLSRFFENFGRLANSLAKSKSKHDQLRKRLAPIVFQLIAADSDLQKNRAGYHCLTLVDSLGEYFDQSQSAKIVDTVLSSCRNQTTKIHIKAALLNSISKILDRAFASENQKLPTFVISELMSILGDHESTVGSGFGTVFRVSTNRKYCSTLLSILARTDQLLSAKDSKTVSEAIQRLGSLELSANFYCHLHDNLDPQDQTRLGDELIKKFFDQSKSGFNKFDDTPDSMEQQFLTLVAQHGTPVQIDSLLEFWIKQLDNSFSQPLAPPILMPPSSTVSVTSSYSIAPHQGPYYTPGKFGPRLYQFIKMGSDENRKQLLRSIISDPKKKLFLSDFCQCKMPQTFADWSARQIVAAKHTELRPGEAYYGLISLSHVVSVDCLASLMKTFLYDLNLNASIIEQIRTRSGEEIRYPWEAMKWIASTGIQIQDIPKWSRPVSAFPDSKSNVVKVADLRGKLSTSKSKKTNLNEVRPDASIDETSRTKATDNGRNRTESRLTEQD